MKQKEVMEIQKLKIKNPEYAKEILEDQKNNAIKRYEYYKKQID